MVRRLWPLALVLLASCGGGGGGRTVQGVVSVPASGAQVSGDSGPCRAGTGFDDIATDAAVTVSDEKGTLVATSTLTDSFRDGPRCAFTFKVSVPSRGFYQFEVSHRGKVSFSAADLDAKHNVLTLTVG